MFVPRETVDKGQWKHSAFGSVSQKRFHVFQVHRQLNICGCWVVEGKSTGYHCLLLKPSKRGPRWSWWLWAYGRLSARAAFPAWGTGCGEILPWRWTQGLCKPGCCTGRWSGVSLAWMTSLEQTTNSGPRLKAWPGNGRHMSAAPWVGERRQDGCGVGHEE